MIYPRHEGIRGNRGLSPLILNLDATRYSKCLMFSVRVVAELSLSLLQIVVQQPPAPRQTRLTPSHPAPCTIEILSWPVVCIKQEISEKSDVLLTVHLSIFISVFNQIDVQNLFHNKFYFRPLHASTTCAHHQEV